MKLLILLISLVNVGLWNTTNNPAPIEQKKILDAVNNIRKKGCYCGNKYLRPAQRLEWNELLYKSAYNQATDMSQHNFFAHYSHDGQDIGQRLDMVGYTWKVAGENLGEGQKSFEEVLEDWLKSYSHCTMLMNPKVNEMAVAKVGKYWVQHFGKQLEQPKIVQAKK